MDTVGEGEDGINWERDNEICTLIYVNLLFDTGSSNPELNENLEEWGKVGSRRDIQEGGTYVYLWLSHVYVAKTSTMWLP